MKNVIMIVLDSLSYERLYSFESNFGFKPFICELAEKGISYKKMYSEAPYTEAAAQALYCAQKTLDNGGHLFRFKNAPETIFETAKEKGYKTFCSNIMLQLYTSSTLRGVDFYGYNNGFETDSLWSYRLKHFSELFSKGEFDDGDYAVLSDILEENFVSWELFFNSVKNNDRSVFMLLSEYCPYDVQGNLEKIKKEHADFLSDKNKYIDELLTQGREHSLLKIKAFEKDIKTSAETKEKVWEKESAAIKKIRHIQFEKNILNVIFGKASRAERIKLYKGKKLKPIGIYAYSVLGFLSPQILKKKFFSKYDSYKNAPSVSAYIDYFKDWRKSDNGDAYFACIHVDDVHHPEIFFTYDAKDAKTTCDDIETALSAAKGIRKGYKGPLCFDLGILYTSNKIRDLYNSIENSGELDNTLFVITSDHGFSFQGTPVREKNVSTFYRENYHIPFVIYNPALKSTVNTDYHNSFEIPDIIFRAAEGREILQNSLNYSTIEFMGAGCPDIKRKKIKLAIFDDNYMVCTDVGINETVNQNNITVYNLKSDPTQSLPLKYSQVKKNDLQLVDSFMAKLNSRVNEIRSENGFN